MINRADKGSFVNWWFTVDRTALLLILVLAGIGQMLAFAASPAVTGRTGFGDFHYAARQVMYAVAAMAILGGSSLLSLRQVKIVAAITFACALIASFLVLFVAACVIHLPQLLGRRLYMRDIHRMFVPAKYLVAESLRHGELPQWWPYDGGGTPFLSSQKAWAAAGDLAKEQLRTIGLSVTVQERILDDFKKSSGVGSTRTTSAWQRSG